MSLQCLQSRDASIGVPEGPYRLHEMQTKAREGMSHVESLACFVPESWCRCSVMNSGHAQHAPDMESAAA